MNDTIRFRLVNKIEKDLINLTLEKISSESDDLTAKLYISLTRGKNPSIYLVSDSLDQELQKFKDSDNLISTGLYFGFIRKGKVFISLEAIDYLYGKNRLSTKVFLIVNSIGEKAVLYGNDVDKRFVIKEPKGLKEGDFLIVFNENHELLAIGISKVNYQKFQDLDQEEKVARTLVNKGSYLKRKQ